MRRVLALLLTCAATARAQSIRGVVLDSATRQPVPGVVVTLLDSGTAVVGRIITNGLGQFNVPRADAIRRLRTQRIGYRLREVRVDVAVTGVTDVEIRVASLPTLLEPVSVVANSRCGRRRDSERTYALLEQARAGLLATAVARSQPAAMRGLSFDRAFASDGEKTASQTVRIKSTVSTVSFGAAKSPKEFVAKGFAREIGFSQEYFGPDVEVLLSDDFAAGYCFKIASADKNRPGQIGLGFDPASRPRGVNGISGTLWIDTVQRVLVDYEFRYLDLGRLTGVVQPGGRASFVEVRPGVVLIDRWALRMPRHRADTTRDFKNTPYIRDWFEPVETGAELATAEWSDGIVWNGTFGKLRALVQSAGMPASGLSFRIDSTDYEGVSDSLGLLVIPELLPGPYSLRLVSPELESIGLEFPVSLQFTATRGRDYIAVVHPPTLDDYAREHCVTDRTRADAPQPYLVTGRVTRNGVPVDRAEIRAKWPYQTSYFYSLRTGTNGRFEVCVPETAKDTQLIISVQAPGHEARTITISFQGVVTRLPIELTGKPE